MNESATATAHHLPPSDNLPLSPGFGKEYWRSIQIFAALFEFVKLCYVIVIGYTYMEYQLPQIAEALLCDRHWLYLYGVPENYQNSLCNEVCPYEHLIFLSVDSYTV
ncbi:uncharacterized protein LOC112000446 isoform X1 [Quercus suber]|uniref:uncharacterized protein LOC112000446 isoform X1 n=1 Tax=Quercus suber TaxID=58331 RepID=UPI0032DF9115